MTKEKKKISAQIVADSINPQGDRITTFVLTYPRMIHAEVMTHRVFSRNAASSRAIPFKKMLESVKEDSFIPIAWQKDHKGMQGSDYESDFYRLKQNIYNWLETLDLVVAKANIMNSDNKVTKQLCNRLLEPFQWYTCLVTVTELDNFYELRCPKYKLIGLGGSPARSRKDWLNKMQLSSALHPSEYPENEAEWWRLSESGAEIHIQALAEAMWDAQNESTPQQLKAGEWHIPFGDRMDTDELHNFGIVNCDNIYDIDELKLCVATARAARLSYMTFDGEIDYTKDIALHDQLLASKHMSPFEHCARAMTDKEYHSFIKGRIIDEGCELSQYEDGYSQEVWIPKPIQGWCNNFKGFIQYRYLIEHGY